MYTHLNSTWLFLYIMFLIIDSPKLLYLFQIILAFGNYMNSSKRGAVYGFKLQSLDMVSWYFLYSPFMVKI